MRTRLAITLLVGLLSLTVQVHAQGTATIYGYVFEDMNGDKMRQSVELPIQDVWIVANGDTAMTDGNGYYWFVVEAPDSIVVTEVDPPLHFSVTPNEVIALVEPGDSCRVDFADSPFDTAVVYGTVFADSNANDVRDTGEPGIPGVAILLDGASTVSNGGGAYSFMVPAPGTYTVTVVPPPGYVPVSPVSRVVFCNPYGSYDVDFGIIEPIPVSMVMGVVFNDLNRSGVRDSAEAGLAGVTVELVLPGGTIPITTNSSGTYHFALPPGEAGQGQVIETNLPEYFSITPDTVSVSVAPGEMCQVDFGDRMKVKVPLDVMPGACPNRVRSKGRSFLAAAIAGTGTGEFEAAEIDPATVRLDGVTPYLYLLKDVTAPYEPFIGKDGCDDCAKTHSDKIMDFSMRFDIGEIRSAIGMVAHDSCVVLHLTGKFTDGFPFMGEDVLLLKVGGKPGAKHGPATGRPTLSAGPNPVSGVATIRFGLAEPTSVRVTVHDILGRQVAVVADGCYEAGLHTGTWDGRNAAGEQVGAGIYFARIRAGGSTLTSKIILLE
jgi:hypothetical protein